MVSFEEGHELLSELAGVQVPTKHVERAAEALGREIAQDEQRVVEAPAAEELLAPTLYLGMDGTGVPVRKEFLLRGGDYYYQGAYGDLGKKIKIGALIKKILSGTNFQIKKDLNGRSRLVTIKFLKNQGLA